MSPAFPVGRFLALTSACFGVGYALMITVVPDADAAYRALPLERRRQIDEARVKRAAWEQEMAKQVRAQRENGPMKPIWEDGNNTPRYPG